MPAHHAVGIAGHHSLALKNHLLRMNQVKARPLNRNHLLKFLAGLNLLKKAEKAERRKYRNGWLVSGC